MGSRQASAGEQQPHVGRRHALQLAVVAAVVAPRGAMAEEEAAVAPALPVTIPDALEELAPPSAEAQVCFCYFPQGKWEGCLHLTALLNTLVSSSHQKS